MTDQGITLNIYDKPPQLDDTNADNINQTEAELNATNTLPTKTMLDNIRPDVSSAPKANYNPIIRDNTREDNEDSSSSNYQNNVKPIPIQQYPQPIIYRPPPINQIPIAPAPTPVIQPYRPPYNPQYNPQYAQPVIIRQNNQTPNVIFKEEKKDNSSKDCCAGFLTGCGAVLAACCLLSLCSGGGRRRRW